MQFWDIFARPIWIIFTYKYKTVIGRVSQNFIKNRENLIFWCALRLIKIQNFKNQLCLNKNIDHLRGFDEKKNLIGWLLLSPHVGVKNDEKTT